VYGEGGRVTNLALATSQCDVDEPAGVCESLLCAALTVCSVLLDYPSQIRHGGCVSYRLDIVLGGGDNIRSLLLLLLVNLGGLRLDLSYTWSLGYHLESRVIGACGGCGAERR